jgi:hypothetical protein
MVLLPRVNAQNTKSVELQLLQRLIVHVSHARHGRRMLGMVDERLCSLCLCKGKRRGHSEVWREMGIFECGGGHGCSRRGAVSESKSTKMAKNLVQSLMRPLVDCYCVHFKYLGCWCSGTVCEENDTKTEPLHFAGCLIIETATSWAGCVAPCWAGTAYCPRVVFTPLLLQWHSVWAKHM